MGQRTNGHRLVIINNIIEKLLKLDTKFIAICLTFISSKKLSLLFEKMSKNVLIFLNMLSVLYACMLDTSIGLFLDTSSKTAVSKLLIILSDGRGVFYEGIEKVKSSVQRALVEGIFIVFVILDITGTSTSSIYDIKMPVYSPGNPIPAIKSYMENFPFPFYICLRDVNSLPMVMIEALKQWFDMSHKKTIN
ncbi:midasin-like [Brachionus plicatilis]|uniref:Midasin-like n=1 Tax=Brachionus plicatilis TaxID=10195 RepID=A0A3M7Q313_BRAPC|nr:midasin-like [Brachionus plicatilis]